MWPFKKKTQDSDNFEEISSKILSLSDGEAKILFLSVCEDLADQISLIPNGNGFNSKHEIHKSVIDFFSEYAAFSPKFMDLDISVENVGESETVEGQTRIGYNSEWSEILCGHNGEVFTVYREDTDGVTFVKSDWAITVWHYAVVLLSNVYPEVVKKNITRAGKGRS